MTISSAFGNANSGLTATGKRAAVVSNNIANALTPGYSRREVAVGEVVINGQGAGVTVNGVTRASNQALTNDRRTAEAVANRDQHVANTYATFNTALGEPEDPYSLFGQYQNLESSLRSLALTPESIPLQTQVLDAAKSLANRFNQLETQTQTIRGNADAEIARNVGIVNDNLGQIEKLNIQISRGKAGGRDITSLEDQRKTLIDEVSNIIPIREIARDNGKIDLMTKEGVFLLAGKPRQVEFTRATALTPASSLAGGQLSGLTVEGIDITPGTTASFAVVQGSLAGLFQVRDEIAPDFQNKMDALASDVMQRFENADSTIAPGSPGLFTDNGAAFDISAQSGLAGRIMINPVVDPVQGGDLWRIRDGMGAVTEGVVGNADLIFMVLDNLAAVQPPPVGAGLSSQSTAIDAVANVTSIIGSSRVSAESRLAASSASSQSLLNVEAEATAVDTDFELQQLLIIEQAYAANARVIQTASQMINQLMEL